MMLRTALLLCGVSAVNAACETAWIQGGRPRCFAELGISRWGWTNEVRSGESQTMDLYAGAGQCDTSKGALAGKVEVAYSAQTQRVSVHVRMGDGWVAGDAALYAGSEYLPRKGRGYTVSPGQFPYKRSSPPLDFVVRALGQGGATRIFVSLHINVCSSQGTPEPLTLTSPTPAPVTPRPSTPAPPTPAPSTPSPKISGPGPEGSSAPCWSSQEVPLVVEGEGHTAVDGVAVVDGMPAWDVDGVTHMFHSFPEVLQRAETLAYFPEGAGTVHCPANCEQLPCEVVVVAPVTTATPPPSGWESGPCAPLVDGIEGSTYPTVSLRTLVPAGATLELPALDTYVVFGNSGATDCSAITDFTQCSASACTWLPGVDGVGGRCTSNWCPSESNIGNLPM